MKTTIFHFKIPDQDRNFFQVNPRGIRLADNWLTGREAFEQQGGVVWLEETYDPLTQYQEITISVDHPNPLELTMFLLKQSK